LASHAPHLLSARLGVENQRKLLSWCEEAIEDHSATLHGAPGLGALILSPETGRAEVLTGEDVSVGPAAWDIGWIVGELLEFQWRTGTESRDPAWRSFVPAVIDGYGRHPGEPPDRAAAPRSRACGSPDRGGRLCGSGRLGHRLDRRRTAGVPVAYRHRVARSGLAVLGHRRHRRLRQSPGGGTGPDGDPQDHSAPARLPHLCRLARGRVRSDFGLSAVLGRSNVAMFFVSSAFEKHSLGPHHE